MTDKRRRPSNPRTTAARPRGAPAPHKQPESLDETDHEILRALRDDARISVSQLATRANISRASAYVRLARLQDSGAITGFTLRVDSKQIGLGIGALITLNVDQGRWRSVHEELASMAEVEWCAVVAGDFDAVILVRAPDIETIRDVVLVRLSDIEGIQKTRTLFILEEAIPHRIVLPQH